MFYFFLLFFTKKCIFKFLHLFCFLNEWYNKLCLIFSFFSFKFTYTHLSILIFLMFFFLLFIFFIIFFFCIVARFSILSNPWLKSGIFPSSLLIDFFSTFGMIHFFSFLSLRAGNFWRERVSNESEENRENVFLLKMKTNTFHLMSVFHSFKELSSCVLWVEVLMNGRWT